MKKMIEQSEKGPGSIARIGWTSSHHGGSDRSMLSDRTGLKGIECVFGRSYESISIPISAPPLSSSRLDA